MRRTNDIEKRLRTVELKTRGNAQIFCEFTSQATATSQVLTGIFIRESGHVELGWDKKPKDDRTKLKWLKQYNQERIDGFKKEWIESTRERDKIALKELDRLLPQLERN
jgi:hypothetical protein